MPTLLNEQGYKFFFYANEHPPPHVHVMKSGGWAKIEIQSGEVIYSSLKPRELAACLDLLGVYRVSFLEQWYEWFER